MSENLRVRLTLQFRYVALTALFPISAWAGGSCAGPNEADPNLVAHLVRYSVPPLDCSKFEAKFSLWKTGAVASDPSFGFFRTSVPWYWDFLRRDSGCAGNDEGIFRPRIHEAMRKFKGFCAGDAHPENFAVQYPAPPAKPFFGVNDPDDADKSCPVLGDILRLVVATKIGVPKVDTQALLAKYIAALESRKLLEPSSAAMNALVARGSNEDTKLPKDASPCRPEDLKKLAGAYVELRAKEGVRIAPPKLADCADESAKKPSGGSGGLPRFTIAFEENGADGKSKKIFVQFKGTQSNGTAYYQKEATPWTANERYAETCAAERGPGANCPVVAIDEGGAGYFVRSKNERAVKLDGLKGAEAQALIEDEAVVIANLHRASMKPKDVQKYASELKRLKASLEVDAESFAKTVKKSADSLRPLATVPGTLERACRVLKPDESDKVRRVPGGELAPSSTTGGGAI